MGLTLVAMLIFVGIMLATRPPPPPDPGPDFGYVTAKGVRRGKTFTSDTYWVVIDNTTSINVPFKQYITVDVGDYVAYRDRPGMDAVRRAEG